MFSDILLDSLIDTAKVFPIIFLVYVLIEFIESREGTSERLEHAFSGRLSPLFGAGIGMIPQCGFSVVATRLFQDGYIYVGTLVAVYLATSDEAIPIMFSRAVTEPTLWLSLAVMMATKFVYATACGFLINLTQKKPTKAFDEAAHEAEHADGCCHHEITGDRHTAKKLLLHPFLHSLKITAYIFVINVLFGVLVEIVIGEETLAAFLHSSVYVQPLVSAVVGLIPNCASSVLITELFADGLITFGGAIAGLAVNSGIGMAVLLRDGKHVKRAIAVILTVFALSLFLGYTATFIEVLIG